MRLIILCLLLTACGPAWHLQEAKKHLAKAEAKGANIKRDTVFKKITFDMKGATTKVDLGPTILHRKDGVQYVPVLKDTIIYKDRIKIQIKHDSVEVKCPDEVAVAEVPVAVHTDIKSGYTKWQYGSAIAGAIIFGLVVGFLLGKIIKVGI